MILLVRSVWRAPATARLRRAMATAPGTSIVWFKPSDLRLADHEPLVEAHKHAAVVHLFVFEPFWHGRSRLAGFPKCGAHRARFLLEAVADLRAVRGAGRARDGAYVSCGHR